MNLTQFLFVFVILAPLSGLYAFGVSHVALTKGAGTRAWAAICLVAYLLFTYLTLVVWPNGLGVGASLFGCMFGMGLARTRHLYP